MDIREDQYDVIIGEAFPSMSGNVHIDEYKIYIPSILKSLEPSEFEFLSEVMRANKTMNRSMISYLRKDSEYGKIFRKIRVELIKMRGTSLVSIPNDSDIIVLNLDSTIINSLKRHKIHTIKQLQKFIYIHGEEWCKEIKGFGKKRKMSVDNALAFAKCKVQDCEMTIDCEDIKNDDVSKSNMYSEVYKFFKGAVVSDVNTDADIVVVSYNILNYYKINSITIVNMLNRGIITISELGGFTEFIIEKSSDKSAVIGALALAITKVGIDKRGWIFKLPDSMVLSVVIKRFIDSGELPNVRMTSCICGKIVPHSPQYLDGYKALSDADERMIYIKELEDMKEKKNEK